MRIWKGMTLIAPLAVALSVAPGPAHAQRGQGPCRQDIEKFCPGIQPGGGRYRDCLQQHASELSPACQQHLSKVKSTAASWRQACKDDVQKLCLNVTPGRGKMVKCLREHEAELSQACKDQLGRRGHRRQAPASTPGQ
jgi:hypothetical protein